MGYNKLFINLFNAFSIEIKKLYMIQLSEILFNIILRVLEFSEFFSF